MSNSRPGAPKRFEDGRLVWYDTVADEAFWLDHWRDGLVGGGMAIDPETDELSRIVADFIDPQGAVLEAGCGSGDYVAALRDHGWPIEGIESSAELVGLVNELRPSLPVRHGDALAIEAEDGSYDGYLSIGVVEHRADGPEPFLTEAHRVLRPGGIAVIAVPTVGPLRRLKAGVGRYRDDPGGRAFFQYGFRPAELEALVTEAGFLVKTTRYYGLARMLDEELLGHRRLPMVRGGTRVRSIIGRLLAGRDGHMVAVVAERI